MKGLYEITNALSNGTIPHPLRSLASPRLRVRKRHQKRQSLLSQERTSNLARSIRTKALKIFGENGAWAYAGTAQIFGVPPIISGTGNATNFKFL